MYFNPINKRKALLLLLALTIQTRCDSNKTITALTTKAPRPDSNSTLNNAVVGPLSACCDFSAIKNQLTQIQNNCESLCDAIVITSPITITSPGSYCLGNDVSEITIAADDVSLNLNNHTIRGVGAKVGAGITILPGNQRKVFNGRISNFFQGIVCNGSDNTILQDLVIDNSELDGIIFNSCTNFLVDSVLISNVENNGFRTTGTNQAGIMQNITITAVEIGFYFENIAKSVIKNCNVIDCLSKAALGAGFAILSGNNIVLENCSVKNCTATINAAGFGFVMCTETIVKDCAAQNIFSDSLTSNFTGGFVSANVGFPTAGIEFVRCSAIGIKGSARTVGFQADGVATSFTDCLAQECITTSTSFEALGFSAGGSEIDYTNCQAYNCTSVGFEMNNTGRVGNISYQNCQSAFNGTGFLTTRATTLIGNCTAFSNSNVGFDIFTGTGIYNCFAYLNGTNYLGAPNVQNANTQVDNSAVGLTGPFAGANLFM